MGRLRSFRIAFLAASLLLHLACAPNPKSSYINTSPDGRKALGLPDEYHASALSPGEFERLNHSILERRQWAWNTVAKIVSPRARSVRLSSGEQQTVRLPAFATWYASDDVQRLFNKLYGDLGVEGRKARQRFSEGSIAATEIWNTTMAESLPHWDLGRFEAFVRGLDNNAKQGGLMGLSRTLYSPSLARHLLKSVPEIDRCLPNVNKADWTFEPLAVKTNFSLCLPEEFPADAVAVKTNWHRLGHGFKVPVFKTNGGALAALLEKERGAWGSGDHEVSTLNSDDGFTIESHAGNQYGLTALHIMTKEAREWLWITLWWSPDADEDFGEDRPAELNEGSNPWRNYKMCVVSSYKEDGEIDADLTRRFPSLAAALTAVQTAGPATSWCSNPYLEKGAGNHRTNCIGCHQHGGTDLDPQTLLEDANLNINLRSRQNFPADYLWSFQKEPEAFAKFLRSRINYYDVYDSLSVGGRR